MAENQNRNHTTSQRGRKRRYDPNRVLTYQQNKLLVTVIILLVALLALIGRLFYIYKAHGLEYQKAVLNNQQYDTTVIPFKRGDILDANGTILATSEKVYNMIIDASVINYIDGRYVEPTLRELGNCFPQLDMAAIRHFVETDKTNQYYVPLKRLSYSEISPFLTIQEGNDYVRGVYFEEEYKRIYPNGSLASTILGYTIKNGSVDGKYGLEEYYDEQLTGIDGRVYGFQNQDDTLERTVKDATNGYTLHTTIDANMQAIVEKYLKEFNDTYANSYREGNGAENLGCIIMDVNTGEIKAMANYPDFDPNNYKDTKPLIGTQLIESYTNAGGYTEYRKTSQPINEQVLSEIEEDQLNINLAALWKNYTIANTYEPGSTMKPFTVAAALEDGAITGEEVYTCNGYLEVGGHMIKCHTYRSGGDGAVGVKESIAWSCNVALMKIAATLGADDFCKFQSTFNFGLKTNVDLAGEARTASLLYSASEMGAADLATNSFGQNFNVTMIQMITGFCSLINGGYYYEPHIVNKITNSSGATVESVEPRVLKQVVSESTSELIREATRMTVMEEGGSRRTGKSARPAGYAIGGKTGTAETLPRKNRQYIVSFMGYAPADDPQIAIYVVVDRANAAMQDDAKYATRIVRNILTEVLPYMGIYMTEPLSEKEIAELEEKKLQVTLQYGQGTASDEETDKNPEYITSGEIIDSTGESASIYPIWMTYPVDQATGYRINPNTGEKLDADTGELITEDPDSLVGDTPDNESLMNPDTSLQGNEAN